MRGEAISVLSLEERYARDIYMYIVLKVIKLMSTRKAPLKRECRRVDEICSRGFSSTFIDFELVQILMRINDAPLGQARWRTLIFLHQKFCSNMFEFV
jgi:hypothetical protein